MSSQTSSERKTHDDHSLGKSVQKLYSQKLLKAEIQPANNTNETI